MVSKLFDSATTTTGQKKVHFCTYFFLMHFRQNFKLFFMLFQYMIHHLLFCSFTVLFNNNEIIIETKISTFHNLQFGDSNPSKLK